jgi:DNA-binding response OmpR family regulator
LINNKAVSKIAIIEDDALLTQMYAQKFKKDGFEVVAADDGKKGLALIKQEKPSLVLLDIMMPEMNGLEVLKAVKDDSDEEINSIPVILLTNLARGKEDVNRGLELGAVTYLVKSKVKPAAVVTKVKEVLEASGEDHLLQTKK